MQEASILWLPNQTTNHQLDDRVLEAMELELNLPLVQMLRSMVGYPLMYKEVLELCDRKVVGT